MKKHVSKAIKPAGTLKSALGFILDLGFMGITAFISWSTLGTRVIMPAAGYDQARDNYQNYALSCKIGYKDSKDELAQYSFVYDEEENWKEKYGIDIPDDSPSYLAYEKVVWDYYYVYVGKSDGVDHGFSFLDGEFKSQEAIGTSSYNQALGKWIYENVFRFEKDATYTAYFSLPEQGYAFMPKLSQRMEEHLSSEDNAERLNALADLHDFFDNAVTNAGAYQNAINHFHEQKDVKVANETMQRAQTLSLTPSLLISPFIFFFLIPLFAKNGRTLGKLIVGTAVLGDDGYAGKWWQLLAHTGFITLSFMALAIPYYVVVIPLVMLWYVIDFIALVMSKNHQSIHDKITHTIVCNAKTSMWFANAESELDYMKKHPHSPLATLYVKEHKGEDIVPAQRKMVAQEQVSLEEMDILDLSTINARKEEAARMTSFDEFERRKDAEYEAKKSSQNHKNDEK